MKDNFTININKELILRIKEYLKYAKIDNTLKTDHWAKRTSNNLDSIRINNESITIFKNDTGLSDEYEALFDKNYVKKINAKKLIKNKIINNLKIKCRENYDPIYYYKKNLPPTPFITLDNVHAEFGKKHHIKIIFAGDIGYQCPPCCGENTKPTSNEERLALFDNIFDFGRWVYQKMGIRNFRFKNDKQHSKAVYKIRDMIDERKSLNQMLDYLKTGMISTRLVYALPQLLAPPRKSKLNNISQMQNTSL